MEEKNYKKELETLCAKIGKVNELIDQVQLMLSDIKSDASGMLTELYDRLEELEAYGNQES